MLLTSAGDFLTPSSVQQKTTEEEKKKQSHQQEENNLLMMRSLNSAVKHKVCRIHPDELQHRQHRQHRQLSQRRINNQHELK